MPDLFVDTSGWACYVDRSQAQHAAALAVYQDIRAQGRRLVTTNYVLAELMALLTQPLRIPRTTVLTFVEALQAAPHIQIVHVDPARDAAAWGLLRSRPDRLWSLVDAASFVVMQERGLVEALTTDHHFEQAGFVRLLI